MGIVERIKELCNNNNTSIKALERDIDISNGSIRHWNTKSPSVERVLLVANKFNVSIDWLLTGKEAAELTANEQELVDLYRNTNDTGQPLITNHAKDIQKALPRQQEIKLSDSKIG